MSPPIVIPGGISYERVLLLILLFLLLFGIKVLLEKYFEKKGFKISVNFKYLENMALFRWWCCLLAQIRI